MNTLSKNNPKSTRKSYLFLAVLSLLALAATFIVANAGLILETKNAIFISIVLVYLVFCLIDYIRQEKETEKRSAGEPNKSVFSDEVEVKLLALEEANRFFGATLKSGDMFRLVASRVNEIVPFAVFTLFLANAEKTKLKIVCAVGENAEKFFGTEIVSDRGLAGKVFQTSKAGFDGKLQFDKGIIAAEYLNNLTSAIAVPLLKNGEIYGVLELFTAAENQPNRDSLALLEAVAARVAPLFLSSLAFEENLANALTDALTRLPNERAFFLVLENQIAESQRFRDERPLTILTIDINNFAELNEQFGHATGDRILRYAADNIKNQLRQMDFLARASGDEFLVVLPTANDKITQEIVERVKKTFVLNPFEVTPEEKIHLQLNFGAASFWKNGETASELLKHGYFRKQQLKTTENNNILWFPKEYVN